MTSGEATETVVEVSELTSPSVEVSELTSPSIIEVYEWGLSSQTNGASTADQVTMNPPIVGLPGNVQGAIQALSDRQTKVAFSYGDASPSTLFQVKPNQTIFLANITIITPFNGIDSQLLLGDSSQPDRLISVLQVDPYEKGEYETNPLVQYGSITNLQLTIIPGLGCTTGNGFVILEAW